MDLKSLDDAALKNLIADARQELLSRQPRPDPTDWVTLDVVKADSLKYPTTRYESEYFPVSAGYNEYIVVEGVLHEINEDGTIDPYPEESDFPDDMEILAGTFRRLD